MSNNIGFIRPKPVAAQAPKTFRALIEFSVSADANGMPSVGIREVGMNDASGTFESLSDDQYDAIQKALEEHAAKNGKTVTAKFMTWFLPTKRGNASNFPFHNQLVQAAAKKGLRVLVTQQTFYGQQTGQPVGAEAGAAEGADL